MTATVDDVFHVDTGSQNYGANSLTITVPRSVAAGKKLILASGRGDGSGDATGLTSIVDSRGNTWTLNDAGSLRQNQGQVMLSHADVTTTLQAGDTITVTWPLTVARRFVTVLVCSGLVAGGPQVTSGFSLVSNTNSGVNGTTAAMSTSLTTTTPQTLLVGAFYYGAPGYPPTAGSSFIADKTAETTVGTSDKAWLVEHRVTTTTGAKTVDATQAAASVWAEAAVAFAVTATSSTAPTANAGPDQSGIEPGAQFTLDFSGSTAVAPATVAGYVVTQTAGPTTPLSGSGASRTGVAPRTLAGTTLTYSLVVTDSGGATSTADTVNIGVAAVAEHVLIGGTWTAAAMGLITGAPSPGTTDGTLAVTVTPEPDHQPPRVRIDINDTRLTPAASLTINRRAADGRTYPVRTSDGNPLPLSGGQATLWDYEAPFGQQLAYTTSDAATPTVSTLLDVPDVWLIHPGIPSRSRIIHITDLPEETRATSRTLYAILNREDPVPISAGARTSAAATMGLRTRTDTDRRNLDLLLDDDQVLLLNIPPAKPYGWDTCYVSCGDLTRRRTVGHGPSALREWQLPIQVVGRPAGGTRAGLTWNDIADQYATWQAIADAGITSWAQLAAPTS